MVVVGLRWLRAAVVGLLLLQSTPSSTAVVASSPAANATVGGHIDLIDVQFDGPVTNPGLLLTAPNGQDVAGLLTQPAQDRIYFQLDSPIGDDGPYWIDYAVVTAGGSEVISRFGFNYRAEAPPPVPLAQRPRLSDRQLVMMGLLFGLLLVGIWYAITHRANGLTHRHIPAGGATKR